MEKTLTLLDLVFLAIESRVQTGHVGGLAIFKLPAGTEAGFFQRAVESHRDWQRAHGSCALKLSRKGVGLGWVEDERVDVAAHIQYLALPRPGNRRQLYTLVERLHAQHLDRQHPLWEATFIEGIEGGCGAIYIKVHHALMDGISAIRLLLGTFTLSSRVSPSRLFWQAELPRRVSANGEDQREGRGMVGTLVSTLEGVVTAMPTAATEALRSALHALGLYGGPAVSTFMAPRTILNRQITGRRHFATHDFSLSEVQTVAKTVGATVNDVVLMVCAGALRRYLLHHDALPKDPLIAWMPVSTRRAEDNRPSNQISMICVSLATNVEDPIARFRSIQASAAAAKQQVAAHSREANEWLALLRGSFPILTDLLGVNEWVLPATNLTISNVPGLGQHDGKASRFQQFRAKTVVAAGAGGRKVTQSPKRGHP
ncbi:MAG TPA: wax ester/triacylglycerol synthase family O-acyltransferase [Candidatus Binatia bacterium]|jgi:diacylglycerol O-acyltransferase|nr:wax ester/triacylglycerol synthase family O-acyltransferase [Candidatus Binatia bacterium]